MSSWIQDTTPYSALHQTLREVPQYRKGLQIRTLPGQDG